MLVKLAKLVPKWETESGNRVTKLWSYSKYVTALLDFTCKPTTILPRDLGGGEFILHEMKLKLETLWG